MQHVHTGSGLLRRAAHIAAESQQPSGQSRTDAAAQLGAQRGAGIHGTIYTFAAGQVGIFRAGGDQGVHIALQRAHAHSRNGSARQHKRDRAQIAGDQDAQTSQSADGIAGEIQLIHAAPFRYQRRRKEQAYDHGNVDGPGEYAQKVGIFQDIGHIVNAHVQGGGINLHQDIRSADHQIVLVADQKAESIEQGVLLLFRRIGINFLPFRKFFRCQLSDGENGQGIGDHADDGIDDGHSPPRGRAAAEISDQSYRDGLDQHAGAKGEHETDGTHLDTLMVISGHQSGQGGISDVVGRIEARVQQCIGDKEPGVLGRSTYIGGDAENRHQADSASEIAVEHPGTRLAHLRMGLVDQ